MCATQVIARRRPDGRFIDGPSAEVRAKAAIRRSASMRQRRYLVTKHLMSLASREDIEAHYGRLDSIIREGAARDAVMAFRTLYGMIAVPPSEDTRVLAEAQVRGVAVPAAAAAEPGPPPTIIVLPTPPDRLPLPGGAPS